VEQSLVPSPPAVVPGSEKVTQAAMAEGALAATLVTMQIASWLILLDFAKFLARYGPSVWQAINTGGSLPAATPERALLDMLNSIEVPTNLVARLGSGIVHASYSVTTTLPQALVQARAAEQKLEDAENDLDLGAAPDEYPTFLFPLAHPGVQVDAGAAQVTEIDPLLRGAYMTPHAGSDAPEDILDRIDALLELVEALPEDPAVVVPDIRPVDQPWDQKDPWFVIRCVYERPNCGPFEKPVLSLSSQPFQMASFFDPDAPQRNVRIPMPLDISPAGLRKFQKNASFIVSDLFCGKISKIRKMTFADLVLSVLPWPFHKNLPSVGPPGPCKDNDDSFGLIFSLSIPIVTLCAMILLIIMVALFDLFFKWIPFLFMAIPIPGLKAKKQVGVGS
ncbi:MAG: hypothetical protein U9P00_09250, partial [Pseudomonadota bacterium]|nr:hypothetical protein [Pseudomonadota bacterium]